MVKFYLSAFADEASPDLDGQIKALTQNNLKHIEIRGVNGKNIIDHSDDELSYVYKTLSASGISVSAIGSPIGKIKISEDFATHMEKFKRTLQIANILNCGKIRIFSFFLPQNENSQIFRDEVFERIDRLLDEAQKSNILCCHENEKEIYGDIKSRCLDLYNNFKGKMSAVFDPANFIQCGENPKEIFDEIKPFTDYIHIKDSCMSDGSIVPAGYGDGGITETLSKIDRDMILSVEPHLSVFDG